MQITMGNDEFILYIRKNYPACSTSSPQLGKEIWAWIQKADPSAQTAHGGAQLPCYWGASGPFISATKLPQTATQFSFDRSILPNLFTFLDTLGTGGKSG